MYWKHAACLTQCATCCTVFMWRKGWNSKIQLEDYKVSINLTRVGPSFSFESLCKNNTRGFDMGSIAHKQIMIIIKCKEYGIMGLPIFSSLGDARKMQWIWFCTQMSKDDSELKIVNEILNTGFKWQIFDCWCLRLEVS